MKKTIFLLVIMFIAGLGFLNAQNVERQQHLMFPSKTLSTSLELPPMRSDEVEIKKINGPAVRAVGNDQLSGTYYFFSCINFTVDEMASFDGAVLHTIKVAVGDQATGLIASTGNKIWLKELKTDKAFYIQDVTPQVGWNEFTITTPYTIPANTPLTIGFTLRLDKLVTGTGARPTLFSDATDPYVPGGGNVLLSTNANAFDGNASWQQLSSIGNLAIIGVATMDVPNNNLGISPLSLSNTSYKLVDIVYPFSANVTNYGKLPQSNFPVQIIDDFDNVLTEVIVTDELAPNKTVKVELPYASPVPGHLSLRAKVILEEDEVPANNTSSPIYVKIFPIKPLGYCLDSDNWGGWGSTSWDGEMHLAIRYSKDAIKPFVGRMLTGIYYGLRDIEYIYSTEPIEAWIKEDSFDTPRVILGKHQGGAIDGWNYFEFDTPYEIPNTDFHLGITYVQMEEGYTVPYVVGAPVVEEATWWNAGEDGVEDRGWDIQEFGTNLIIGVLTGTVNCEGATDFNVEYEKDGAKCTAVLSWSTPPVKESVTYNVYRNNEKIGTTTEITFRDEKFDITMPHRWEVAAVCEDGTESISIGKNLPKCPPTQSIKETVKTGFSILPNPASSNINISAENDFHTVEVINFLGQTVISQPNNSNMADVNVSNLTNGIYFVRIVSNTGASVQKFVKQ